MKTFIRPNAAEIGVFEGVDVAVGVAGAVV